MPLSLELLFDKKTSSAIAKAWALLAPVAASDYVLQNGVHPHVALVVVEVCSSQEALAQATAAVAETAHPIRLTMSGISSFSGSEAVAYVGFEKSPDLVALHERATTAVSQLGLCNHVHYRPRNWVPHCTLAQQVAPSRLQGVLTAAATFSWALPFQVHRLALVEYPPTMLRAEWPLHARRNPNA
jgi:2'-5' RNA ligase